VSRGFSNVYDDARRAESYDALEYPATYYLAFRDIPALIAEHVSGTRALDFGCGAGRSTRFLRGLGFDVVGVDIAEEMLVRARARDPEGDYRLVPDGDLSGMASERYDLILCAFTFDNVPTLEKRAALFEALAGLLTDGGRILNLVSDRAIYINEWASFSTRDFPENRSAGSGDRVRIVMLDVADRRPVEDVLCTDAGYREIYAQAGLDPVAMHSPLGDESEPYPWVSETEVSPWAIYVLARRE
jgi:SAM-dependent methyltransferase